MRQVNVSKQVDTADVKMCKLVLFVVLCAAAATLAMPAESEREVQITLT